MLYTKSGRMSPYTRGKLKSTLNTGQRRRAITNTLESEGLPHEGVDPAGTSSGCLGCGQKLRRAAVRRDGSPRGITLPGIISVLRQAITHRGMAPGVEWRLSGRTNRGAEIPPAGSRRADPGWVVSAETGARHPAGPRRESSRCCAKT